MNELQIIQSKIYEIRGQKVMLDRDLADLYNVTTSNLNKAVKRNEKRFPSDIMFQLTKAEFDELKSNLIFQNGTSRWGGTRKLPYAFTEQGLAMLSGLLNSDIAIQVNINIMRAFVAIRQMITDNSPLKRLSTLEKNFNELKQDLEEIFADYNDINEDTRAQIEAINTTLAELQAKPKNSPRRPVGFKTKRITACKYKIPCNHCWLQGILHKLFRYILFLGCVLVYRFKSKYGKSLIRILFVA